MPREQAEQASRIIQAVRTVAGRPFAEICPPFQEGADSDKALGRRVLDFVLREAEPVDDLLRTVPLGAVGQVLEPTKVCALHYQSVCDKSFELSGLPERLAAIVFIPILKPDRQDPRAWCFETPFRWVPSSVETAQLRLDYQQIRGLIQAGLGDALSSSEASSHGRILMPKTSGRNRDDLESYEAGPRRVVARKRAFFLRKSFTASLLARHLSPRAGQPNRSKPAETTRMSWGMRSADSSKQDPRRARGTDARMGSHTNQSSDTSTSDDLRMSRYASGAAER